MIKVFYRYHNDNPTPWWTFGKEYEAINGFVIDDSGDAREQWRIERLNNSFTRIEREVFEAHGKEWFKHVPGYPMPCDGEKEVSVLLRDLTFGGTGSLSDEEFDHAENWDWSNSNDDADIIGWRYVDEQKSESQESNTQPTLTIEQKMLGITDPNESVDSVFESLRDHIHYQTCKIGNHTKTGMPEPTGCTIDDSHLTPNQKRHWEQAEAKQAAKEQQAKDDKAAAEKAHDERFNGYSESLAKDHTSKNFSGMMGWKP